MMVGLIVTIISMAGTKIYVLDIGERRARIPQDDVRNEYSPGPMWRDI